MSVEFASDALRAAWQRQSVKGDAACDSPVKANEDILLAAVSCALSRSLRVM